MPKKARSHAFIPRRRKEGEDAVPGPLARYISVNCEDIEGLLHLPLKDAAREIGLCPTTFKKACRMFHIEHWPPQKAQRQALIARTDAHADAFDAAITALHQEPVCALAAPTLQTTEVHQDKHAVTVSCTPPVWHDGSIAWRDTSAFCFHKASMALDTRGGGEAGHVGPAFQHKTFAPLDAPSYIDSLSRGSICIGVPMPECLTMTGARSWEQGGVTPLEAGPLREQSCVAAVMEYLDGPLAKNFDFMFADEAGSAAGAPPPHVGAWLDGVDNGAEC
jgi:hypothetical protein